MSAEKLVAQRIRALHDKGKCIDDHDEHSMRAWIHAMFRVCCQLWPDGETYVERYKLLANRAEPHDEFPHDTVGSFLEGIALAEHVLNDIKCGLIGSFINRAKAEVFDDLLDQAEYYLADRNQPGAGVLASSVFEDCVRRIARIRDISEKNVKMDDLITNLQKGGTFSAVKAKRCRAAAGVRTKALHAQWDEFDLDDVRSTIALARELILEHLDRQVQ